MTRKSYTVQPILKALRLFEAVARKSHDVTLTEISNELDLPKTTTFRYLQTLSVAGFLRHDVASDRYSIGPRVSMFAETAADYALLRSSALPKMKAITDSYGETVNLAVSSGLDIVYIQMTKGGRQLRMQARIGEHHPLHSTAVGKAILAFLPPGERDAIIEAPLTEMTMKTVQSIATLRRHLTETQRRGYALEREETETGLSCVGVPLFDKSGYPIAALSLAAPDKRLMSIVEDAARDLKRAADEISARLNR